MKIKFKKCIGLVILLSVLVVPNIIYAASYSTSYSFKNSVSGSARSYSAGKINLSLSSTQNTTKGLYKPASSSFEVELYRQHVLYSTYIGNFYAPRDGSKSSGWTNMSVGNYFVRLSKIDDGCYINGTMKMTQ